MRIYLAASLHLLSKLKWYRNINLLSVRLRFSSLGLGPDFPRADEPAPGNLRLSADRILTYLIVTHSCILTSDTSSLSYNKPSTAYRTLSYHQ